MAKFSPKHFFSHNPTVNAQRTMFDMSKTDTVTINPDYYYPNYKLLVIPGDTVSLDYSNMIRLVDPLNVPMMDNLWCDIDFWYVRFRDVWDYTNQFFGEKKRPSDPDINSLPYIEFTSQTLPQVGSIYDYFGVPIAGTDNLLSGAFRINNALPFMSYYLIHDDWIRDEQRQGYLLDTPDFKATSFSAGDFSLYKRGKRFDYFTSTTLEPQIGGDTTLPLATSAPVYGSGYPLSLSNGVLQQSIDNGTTPVYTGIGQLAYSTTTNNHLYPTGVISNSYLPNTASGSPAQPTGLSQGARLGVMTADELSRYNLDHINAQMYSGLEVNLRDASSVSVEQLRRAFQVQAYKELLNRYGTRMPEYLYSMYGIVADDIELGRPLFLGRVHHRLSVQPIVQNSESNTTPLGNLGAIVSGGTSDSVFTRSFTDFGYIIGCINIYADLTYFQGLDKDLQLQDRMDFPVNVFANLTDQPVYKSEICLTGTSSDDEVFGYQEIYAWAKYDKNTLRGLVRPNAPQSIGYWSLAQQFASVPVNNDTFIQSSTDINRIVNDNAESPTTQHFIVNQEFKVKLTRELPNHSDPMKWMFRG